MAINVMSWVWDNSAARGVDRLVLLAIADSASDHGGNAYPAVATLARKSGVGVRTVQRALRALVEIGELQVQANAGPRGANLYRVVMRQSDAPANLTPLGTDDTPPINHPVIESVGGVIESRNPRPVGTRTVLEPSRTVQQQRDPRGNRLPDGWLPDTALIAWARSNGYTDEFTKTETETFIDYWNAQPGAKGRKTDWPGTWRNWIRRASNERGRGSPTRRGPSDVWLDALNQPEIGAR